MLVEKLIADLLFVDVDQVAKVLLVKVTHVGKKVRNGFDNHIGTRLDGLLSVGSEERHHDVVVGWLGNFVI